jgi:2'-5' RNA ligase
MTADRVAATGGRSAILVPIHVPAAIRRICLAHDPAAAAGVPPHITLLFPFMPPDRLDAAVRSRAAAAIGAPMSFDVAFPRIGRFPDVTYLAPEPSGPLLALIAALADAFPDYQPYGGAFDEVVPHLTLAHTPEPDTHDAVEQAVAPRLPIRATITRAVVMGEGRDGRWRLVWRLPFGQASIRR